MKKEKQKLRKEPPKRSVLEEVGNAVTHGIGALLGIAGLILLLVHSDTGSKLYASLIYGLCFIMMFLMSCLYHSFRWGTGVKRLWRRFDYITIKHDIKLSNTSFILYCRVGADHGRDYGDRNLRP